MAAQMGFLLLREQCVSHSGDRDNKFVSREYPRLSIRL